MLHPWSSPQHHSWLPTGSCRGTAVPCERGQVNGKAKSDMGNSWVPRKGGGCSTGIAVGHPPCPGTATGAAQGAQGMQRICRTEWDAAAPCSGCKCQGEGKAACALRVFFPFLSKKATKSNCFSKKTTNKTNLTHNPKDY